MTPFSTTVSQDGRSIPVTGHLDPRFKDAADRLCDAFAAGQTGACLAVTLEGRPVVDLWGGFSDAAGTQAWREDTLLGMHSVAKTISAATLYILVDRGLVDPDKPVATWWPEFAEAGKGDLPLRYVLDHRAGLAYTTEPLPRGAAYEPGRVAAALARQAPLWEPGTAAGYHVLTQGFIEAEVVRRVTGKPFAQFFQEEIAGPLGVDYHYGVPDADLPRVADQVSRPENMLRQFIRSGEGPVGRFWVLYPADEDFNSRAYRQSEVPSDSAHGNARAVARILACLANGGELDGVRLMQPETVAAMTTEQHNLVEQFMGRHYHQACGMVLNSPPHSYQGPNPRAFGHQGVGGGIGFADPDAKVGFAYGAANHDVDGQTFRDAMIDAVFAAL